MFTLHAMLLQVDIAVALHEEQQQLARPLLSQLSWRQHGCGRAAGPGAVGIEFSQVGKDQGAQRFLATLDKDPQVGKMIDAT